jgi:8-oxo-dGTP diphosphatase
MNSEIAAVYGNRVRVRVCGLLWQGEKLLLVNHKLLKDSELWAPPGGGVEFGASLEENLKREFREETGLEVVPGKFCFGCEFIQNPLHAIELFFDIRSASGDLIAGYDPEIQVIEGVEFLSFEEVRAKPPEHVHGIFKVAQTAEELRKLSGFYRI